MDPLDLILAELGAGWHGIMQYFEIPEVMMVFAGLFIVISLVLINQRH